VQEDFNKYNGKGTMLRKAQMRMLEILVEVDKICKKHNINYWIDYGTLLGAVRHGGFIPWDDDIDISMLRKDYVKLRKILLKELPAQFVFEDWKTKKEIPYKHGKVRDLHSFLDDPLQKSKKGLQGVYIDIFPKEKTISFKTRKVLNTFYGKIFGQIFWEKSNGLKRALAFFLFPFISVYIWLVQTFVNLSYSNKLSQIFGGIPLYHECFISDVFPLDIGVFEGYSFPIPKNVHTYLTYLYGNYMQIPPQEKRIVHATTIDIW